MVGGFLEGLKVLDLSRLLPGPFAAMMLAEMGAEVIKLEDTDTGDLFRTFPPMAEGVSLLYASANRGKKNLSVNVKTEQGQAIVFRLIEAYDIVIEGFRPGVLQRLGLGYETLKKHNPAVILCSITGYGQSGEMKDRAGHDLNYQSLAGIVEMTGKKGEAPALPGTQIADLGGSQAAVSAILAAVIRRQKTGEGAHLDIAMRDQMVALQPIAMTEATLVDPDASRGDTMLSGKFVCYNVYETKDGRHMALAALEPKFFMNFCEAVGNLGLMPYQYAEAKEDSEGYREVVKLFKSKTIAEWAALLKDVDACCTPVLKPSEVYEDGWLGGRDLFFEEEQTDGKRLARVVASPIAYERAKRLTAAKVLGEHTKEVLGALGYSQMEIEAMAEAGAIRIG